ncbi:hypothetical protein Van01_62240 [Micromonospora andamanensis]|uniref:Uncharacterized protein n=1 Tax=Micromonospora andamanensis TaxID=1287068 RepID=A0ABQ4I532_9ACTN|nr:hypothetical protein Van01_62240 [Micromonospora andamanensis]
MAAVAVDEVLGTIDLPSYEDCNDESHYTPPTPRRVTLRWGHHYGGSRMLGLSGV